MPDPAVRLLEVTPDEGHLFDGWCGVWTASELDERPDDPPRPRTEHLAAARELLAPGGSRDAVLRAAVAGDEVVGAARVVLSTQDNLSVAALDVAVHPAHRRRGVGSALLAEVERLARTAGRTTLVTELDEPGPGAPGRAFALRAGFSCDLVETRRDLLLPPDEQRLAALEERARAASRDYRLVVWRDETPEELVDDRALLERRMSTDAPHGDLPLEEEHWDAARVREYERMHRARGRTVLSAGAVRDGRLVAFTDLQVPREQPERAHQAGTLVLREHRGHRLGALVKAAVLRELARALPEVRRVTTYNAESNAPMVAVNEALGFVVAGHLSSWSRPLDAPG